MMKVFGGGALYLLRRFLRSSSARASREAFFCVMGSLSYVNFSSSSCSFFRCWRTCCRLSATTVNLRRRRRRNQRKRKGRSHVVCMCVRTCAVSPVLQLVNAGVGRPTDAGDLLPLLPLRQLLANQVWQQRLGDAQNLGKLGHHVLNTIIRRERRQRRFVIWRLELQVLVILSFHLLSEQNVRSFLRFVDVWSSDRGKNWCH